MKFNERFNNTLVLRNIKKLEVADSCNVSKSTVTRWSNGRNVPNSNQLLTISNLLNVSPEYLLGTTDDIGLDYREILIIKIMHLDPINQKRVYDFIKGLENLNN